MRLLEPVEQGDLTLRVLSNGDLVVIAQIIWKISSMAKWKLGKKFTREN